MGDSVSGWKWDFKHIVLLISLVVNAAVGVKSGLGAASAPAPAAAK